MATSRIYKSKNKVKNKAFIKKLDYDKLYKESIDNPERFWSEQGKRLSWYKPYNKICDYSYDKNNVYVKWFEDGTLNASFNCLDRHVEKHPDSIAIIWEGDDPSSSKKITYKELLDEVCKLSNGLKSLGITKGWRHTSIWL